MKKQSKKELSQKKGKEQTNRVEEKSVDNKGLADQDANAAVKQTYEDVVYSSNAFPKTGIASLAGRAKVYGLAPVPVETARVLELGCSFGGNIISQALYHPSAEFVGVDLSSTQIKHGMEIIEEMGLTNVRLEEKNILDIDKDFGTFDYIIVHGIWSWVPDVVKDKILNICSTNLSSRGVAYVSYNTYPGWKRLEQFRDIMLYATRNKEDMSLANRTVYGKEVLHLLGQTMNMDNNVRTNQEYKLRNLENVLNANNYYVSHEYFEVFNDPVYFHEFAARAKTQGCAYIGDCSMNISYATWLPEAIKDNLLHLADGDYIAKEQYIDYVYDTQFRCSLLTKASNESKIRRNEDVDTVTMKNLYFLSTTTKGVADDLTNTFHRAVKVVMDSGQCFQFQDVVNYLSTTYPGIAIDENAILSRMLYLLILNQIDVLDERIRPNPFEDNITYIPERYLKYVTAIVEKGANTYIGPANMLNAGDNRLDFGVLHIMKLLAKPTTREALINQVGADLTVTRKTADGMEYQVAAPQYVDQVLNIIGQMGYFEK